MGYIRRRTPSTGEAKMKWRTPFLAALVAAAGLHAGTALAQPVSATWALTSSTAVTSSQPSLVTGTPAVLSAGSAPTVSVFDYTGGQRLNAGSSGWTQGPASPTRYLQFDAMPTPGHQLTVSSVSFASWRLTTGTDANTVSRSGGSGSGIGRPVSWVTVGGSVV